MDYAPKDWFIISFSELKFEESEVRDFLELWFKKREKTFHRMIARSVAEKYQTTSMNPSGIYYTEQGVLFDDGIQMPFTDSEHQTKVNVGLILKGKKKLLTLQKMVRQYLDEVDKAYKAAMKYPYSVQRMLENEIDKLSRDPFNETLQERITSLRETYHEYFNPPNNYKKHYINAEDLHIVIPKPFGSLTEELNKNIQQISYGISSSPIIGPDGIYYFTVEPQIKTFEEDLYIELIEFQKSAKHPLKCESCGLFIRNPTRYQEARARRGHAVLHKPEDPEKLKARKEGKRGRIYWSDCELAYYQKKDENYYKNTKQRKRGESKQ
ncbi:hypothetical protein AM500_05530 [Bacillus sp. FJAT-18017]|uniref:hypothetical protein n=1 Tax=Bacillus sp. FJAT-18017 TaxID=1705566 RepID=UPI0006AE2E84|nr:hypothetical protein [Bacillus sp. FJAT-18017]ALC89306.1 hypothetical protein AM500_05530 [Bacillus sp. FJAT-18017]